MIDTLAMVGHVLESSSVETKSKYCFTFTFKDKVIITCHSIAARLHMNQLIVFGWEQLSKQSKSLSVILGAYLIPELILVEIFTITKSVEFMTF